MLTENVPTISVLMATYGRESAENLARSLNSIFAQTLPPDECVLAIDGPIGPRQERVIEHFSRRPGPPRLVVERQQSWGGLANALNAGLRRCQGDLIARMDSDDIALPERLEIQAKTFQERPDIDALGTWIMEFEAGEERPVFVRKTPEWHDEIVSKLKWRNVVSHPTVMIKRSALLRVGGYSLRYPLLEDYELYVRLLLSGARFHCLQMPLLLFQISRQQRIRRGGLRYAYNELAFRSFCRRVGFLSQRDFLLSLPPLIFFRLIPAALRGQLYRFVRVRPAQLEQTVHEAIPDAVLRRTSERVLY